MKEPVIGRPGGRFRYHRPRNMAQALASLPLFIALIFACAAWEVVGLAALEYQAFGLIGGGVMGLVAGLIGVRWYFNRKDAPKPLPQIDPSEEGTATDPDLYNLRDR